MGTGLLTSPPPFIKTCFTVKIFFHIFGSMEKKKEKQQAYLWKWQHLLPVFYTLLGIFIGWFLSNQISKTQIEQSKRELEYSTEPKCDLEFVKGSTIRSTAPYFLLTNHGPGQLDDVWLKEALFFVDTGGVHECPDLPHFEYMLYCGSSTSMGSLDVGPQKKIDTDPCLGRAFYLFFSKFSGELVSRFRLEGSARASPEYKKDFFFIVDCETLQYVAPYMLHPTSTPVGKT
jgi:hypothetical protein